jgi:hypothetical protein
MKYRDNTISVAGLRKSHRKSIPMIDKKNAAMVRAKAMPARIL